MLGILVQLALSLLIAWYVEKKNLSVLGLRPTRQRLSRFAIHFVLTSCLCGMGFLLKMYIGKNGWQWNPGLSAALLLQNLWSTLKSVLFEELLFRGVLLYILIRRWSTTKGIACSAIAFGIYHWFSFGVLGQPVPMVLIFSTTGAMGLLLAYGYAKNMSLYIPIGIHLGWNVTQSVIFSQGPIGNGLFLPPSAAKFRTDSYFVFLIVTCLPMLLTLLINCWLIRKLANRDDRMACINTTASFP